MISDYAENNRPKNELYYFLNIKFWFFYQTVIFLPDLVGRLGLFNIHCDLFHTGCALICLSETCDLKHINTTAFRFQ